MGQFEYPNQTLDESKTNPIRRADPTGWADPIEHCLPVRTLRITRSAQAIFHFNNDDSPTRRASDGSSALCAVEQVRQAWAGDFLVAIRTTFSSRECPTKTQHFSHHVSVGSYSLNTNSTVVFWRSTMVCRGPRIPVSIDGVTYVNRTTLPTRVPICWSCQSSPCDLRNCPDIAAAVSAPGEESSLMTTSASRLLNNPSRLTSRLTSLAVSSSHWTASSRPKRLITISASSGETRPS